MSRGADTVTGLITMINRETSDPGAKMARTLTENTLFGLPIGLKVGSPSFGERPANVHSGGETFGMRSRVRNGLRRGSASFGLQTANVSYGVILLAADLHTYTPLGGCCALQTGQEVRKQPQFVRN